MCFMNTENEQIETLHFLIQELQNKYKITDQDLHDCYLILENSREY